jgi:multiple sugar transport system permease protein
MAPLQPASNTPPGAATVPAGPPGTAIAPPPPPAPREDAGASPTSGALRNVVLAVFLLYCLLPAAWIIAAMTKDNGQLFSTFGLWFAYPPYFLENLADLFTYQNAIFLRWFGNSLL